MVMTRATTQAFTGRYSDPAGTPPHEEQCSLARRAQAGDLDARNEMVRRNMGLVYDRVDKVRWRASASAVADMEQEGVIGLMEAIDQFDPDRGFRFSTYARWWIDTYIQRYLLANPGGSPIRVPVHAMHAHYRAQKLADDEREAAEERDPMLVDAKRAVDGVVTLFRIGRGGDEYCDLIDSFAPSPSAGLEHAEEYAGLHAAMAMLDDRSAVVIRRRYGMGGEHPAYLREVAVELGCSVELVRRHEHRALKHLRAAMDPDTDTETPGRQAGRTADPGTSPGPLM